MPLQGTERVPLLTLCPCWPHGIAGSPAEPLAHSTILGGHITGIRIIYWGSHGVILGVMLPPYPLPPLQRITVVQTTLRTTVLEDLILEGTSAATNES